MDEKHKSVLQSSYVFLKKNIQNPMDVCDHLQADEILTPGMVDAVKVKTPKPTAQVGELLTILPRRGRKAYESFKTALKETENKDAFDHLSQKDGALKQEKDTSKTEDKVCEKQEETKESTVKHSENEDKNVKLQAADKDWPNLEKFKGNLRRKEVEMCTLESYKKICGNGKVYDMHGKKKGIVLRFSNLVDLKQDGTIQENRNRVDFDLTSTDQLFKYMEFEQKFISSFTQEDVEKTISEVTGDYGSLFVIFFSGGIGFKPGEIYDKEGKEMSRDGITDIIRNCESFKEKPKVVIIRSYDLTCEGVCHLEGDDKLDAAFDPDIEHLKENDDDLFVVSSRPNSKKGPWIMGSHVNGSYFIQALIDVFKKMAHERSFIEMIQEVNKRLSNAVVPLSGKRETTKTAVAKVIIYECCKKKKLFLFPGLKDLPKVQCTVLKTVPEKETWPDPSHGNVKKSDISKTKGSFYTEKVTAGEPFYEMIGPKKGKLIVISNVHCPDTNCPNEVERRKKCREHLDFDSANITNIFKYMQFENKGYDLLKNASKENIIKFLEDKIDAIDKDTAAGYDSLAVVILSGKFESEATEVYDSNGDVVPREDIQQKICSSKTFKGKPKMIIIQTYNFKEKVPLDNVDASVTDNGKAKIKGKPNSQDLFVVSSFLTSEDGPWMVGKDMHGSYFIQGLIHVLKKFACEASFMELMDKLNCLLAKACLLDESKTEQKVAEVVILEHSTKKELYLFPLLDRPSFSSSQKGKPVSQPTS